MASKEIIKREIYVIPEESKRQSKKQFSYVSIAISLFLVLLLFLPFATINGVGVGSIIGGTKHSSVYGLLCTVVTVVVFGRVLLSFFSLWSVRMEVPEKREKDIVKRSVIIAAIHVVVYIATIIFLFVYMDTQASYYKTETVWFKIVMILVFFPHGLIKEGINYLTAIRCNKKTIETSASTFNAKIIRFMIWKFVPALLAVILFVAALPSLDVYFYPHQKLTEILSKNSEYTIGKSNRVSSFMLTVDGEAIPTDLDEIIIKGDNWLMHEELIANLGGSSSADAVKQSLATLSASYEKLTFSRSGDLITITSYLYNANPADTEKVGSPALNFIDEGLFEDGITLKNYKYSIPTKNQGLAGNILDFAKPGTVIATITYNDGSMYFGYLTPTNVAELNDIALRYWQARHAGGPEVTAEERKPNMNLVDMFGNEYSVQIEIK